MSHDSRLTIISEGTNASRRLSFERAAYVIVSSQNALPQRSSRSDSRKTSRLDRQRAPPGDAVEIHLHDGRRVPSVPHERSPGDLRRHVPAVAGGRSHAVVGQRGDQLAQPGAVRNRVGVEQGHHFVREVEAGDGLHHAAALEAARIAAGVERLDAQVSRPAPRGHVAHHAPGGIVRVVDHHAHVVPRIVLVEQGLHAIR